MTPKQALTNFLQGEEFASLLGDIAEGTEKLKTRLLEVVDCEPKRCHCGMMGVYQLPNASWVCYNCFSNMETLL